MAKIKLNALIVQNATCPPGKKRLDLWDEITTGFVVEIRASGNKTYYLRYFDQSGRQRQQKIGRVGDITFDRARTAAKRLRAEVILGGDPLVAKRTKRAVPTYATLAQQHIDHAKTYQKSWWSVAGIITKYLEPRFGRVRLDEIKPQDVVKFFAELGAHELKDSTVTKIRATLHRSFVLGRQWSIPGCDRNPVQDVPRRKFNNARNRYLTAAESGRLLLAAEKSSQPQLKPLIQLYLLTGLRKSELLRVEWRHVDFERRSLLVEFAKTGARHVPLSQAAIDVLEKLPRLPACPWVVPNLSTGLPLVDFKRAWDTVRRKAGLPDVRIHDLRHSAASFMINAGVDLYAVGRVLGHTDHKSTMRYSHLANDTLLAAVEAGAAGMGGTAKQA